MRQRLAIACLLSLASACHKGAPPPAAFDAAPAASVSPEAEPPPPAPEHVRVDNPFAGAELFVNPDYREAAIETVAYAPADLLTAIKMVAETPTAVWLSSIADIDGLDGRSSVRAQLDAALRQQEGGDRPVTIAFVLYDLPNRDCAANATAGELKLEHEGMRRYREEFVDPIVALLGEPQYAPLRVVTILEPDSLPNLVTNLEGNEACQTAAPAYREGVAYAIEQLATLPNAYIYVDIAHSGWLGWGRPAEAAALYREVFEAAGGEDLVTGFATNVSNYVPLEEPFDPASDPDRYGWLVEDFYAWNPIIDEHRFAAALREHFPDHGFVIDTSRNGWGGRLEDVPRDGRTSRGNWCNVKGAGLGESPRADPEEGIHAYFWVKPPGLSDGASKPSLTDDRHPFDPMCDPTGFPETDATPDAPATGQWFAEAFFDLVRNAHPPF